MCEQQTSTNIQGLEKEHTEVVGTSYSVWKGGEKEGDGYIQPRDYHQE